MAPISIPEVKGVSVQQQPINPPQTPLSLGQNTNAALGRGIVQGVSSVVGALDQVRRDANRRKIDAQNEIDKLQVTNAVTGWHERTGVQFAEKSRSVTGLEAIPGMVNGAFRPGFHADMAGFERDVTANIFEGLTQTQQQMFNLQIGRARGTYGIKTADHQASQASLAKADASKSERDSFEFRGSSISNMDSPEYLELQDDVIDHVSNTNLDPESQLRLLEQIMGGVNAKVVDNDLFIALRDDPDDLRRDLVNGEFDEFLTEGKVATWIDRVDAEIKERNTIDLDASSQFHTDRFLDGWVGVNTSGDGLTSNQTRSKIKEDFADDPELRDEVLDRFDSESKAFTANQKVQKDRANATTRTAVDALVEVKAWDDAILEAKLNPDSVFSRKEVKRINDLRQGKSEKGNQSEYFRMLRLAGGTPAEQDEFLGTSFSDLNLKSGNEDKLFSLAEDMLAGGTQLANTGFTFSQAAAKTSSNLKLNEMEQNEFDTRFQEEVTRFEELNKRKATPEELIDIGNSLGATVDFSGWNESAFEFSAGDISDFDPEEIEDPRAVPPIDATKIIADFESKNGRPPTPEEVLTRWKAGITKVQRAAE